MCIDNIQWVLDSCGKSIILAVEDNDYVSDHQQQLSVPDQIRTLSQVGTSSHMAYAGGWGSERNVQENVSCSKIHLLVFPYLIEFAGDFIIVL